MNTIGFIKKFLYSLFLSTLVITQAHFPLLGNTAWAQNATLLPNAMQQFLDSNGNPLSSGTVDTYIPGTTTRKTTWQNAGKTVTNTNPIVLDAAGRALIFGDGSYRQIVKDSIGNTIWDQITASYAVPGSGSSTGDGNLVGTVLTWAGIVAPSQYVFAYGQEISRTTYSTFYAAVTKTQNVTCSSGSPTLTSVVDTSFIPVGANIEASCLAPGATVVSKTASTITMSINASVSATVSSIAFPYGNGNGSTTFNVPDLRGVVLAGRPNMGGVASSNLTSTYCGENPEAVNADCGSQSKVLTQPNLPSVNFTVSIPAGQGVHSHTYAAVLNQSGSASGPGGTPGAAAQSTQPTDNALLPAMSGTAASGGSSTAFSLIQPTKTFNYVIKISPDVSNLVATGVMSLGGMTGAIECGGGLSCTGNIISVTGITSVPFLVSIGGTGQTSFTANLPLIGNGTSAIGQGTLSGNTTKFVTTTGSLTSGNCVSIDASGNFVAAGASCGSGSTTAHAQNYVAPTDFTPGVTTSLVLSSAPTTSSSLMVAFDGIVQSHNTWSLLASTVTFSAAIPASVQVVEMQWVSSTSVSGVAAIGGITGSVTCGFGLDCGTISQTVTSKGPQWDNIKLRGAVGANASLDTAALQAAITASTSAGSVIYIPGLSGGTCYSITSINATNKSNLVIRGDGSETSCLKVVGQDASNNWFDLAGSNNIVIQDIKIVRDNSTVPKNIFLWCWLSPSTTFVSGLAFDRVDMDVDFTDSGLYACGYTGGGGTGSESGSTTVSRGLSVIQSTWIGRYAAGNGTGYSLSTNIPLRSAVFRADSLMQKPVTSANVTLGGSTGVAWNTYINNSSFRDEPTSGYVVGDSRRTAVMCNQCGAPFVWLSGSAQSYSDTPVILWNYAENVWISGIRVGPPSAADVTTVNYGFRFGPFTTGAVHLQNIFGVGKATQAFIGVENPGPAYANDVIGGFNLVSPDVGGNTTTMMSVTGLACTLPNTPSGNWIGYGSRVELQDLAVVWCGNVDYSTIVQAPGVITNSNPGTQKTGCKFRRATAMACDTTN